MFDSKNHSEFTHQSHVSSSSSSSPPNQIYRNITQIFTSAKKQIWRLPLPPLPFLGAHLRSHKKCTQKNINKTHAFQVFNFFITLFSLKQFWKKMNRKKNQTKKKNGSAASRRRREKFPKGRFLRKPTTRNKAFLLAASEKTNEENKVSWVLHFCVLFLSFILLKNLIEKEEAGDHQQTN